MNRKYIVLILLILCLVAVIILSKKFIGGDESSSGKKNVLYSLEDISDRINQEMDSEEDGVVALNISFELTDQDLKNVNLSINSMKGSITKITSYESNNDNLNDSYRKVEFYYERSDAMYVYDAIVNNKTIPAEKTDAIKLKSVCESFLSSKINKFMTDYDKELVIHDYIVNNCTYGLSDKSDDSEFEAYGALVNGKAVCSGYASAMNLLLMCSGVESVIITGKATSTEGDKEVTENHAWNLVKLDGNWYHVDVTWDDPVGPKQLLSHEYFNIKDDIIDDTHEWDRKEYDKCDKMDSNYFMKKGAYLYDIPSLKNYVYTEILAGHKDHIECALSHVSLDDDSLQFIYEYDGVYSLGYSTSGSEDYMVLSVYINQ